MNICFKCSVTFHSKVSSKCHMLLEVAILVLFVDNSIMENTLKEVVKRISLSNQIVPSLLYILKRDQLVNLLVIDCTIGLFIKQAFIEIVRLEKQYKIGSLVGILGDSGGNKGLTWYEEILPVWSISISLIISHQQHIMPRIFLLFWPKVNSFFFLEYYSIFIFCMPFSYFGR